MLPDRHNGVWQMSSLVPLGARISKQAECPVGSTVDEAADALLGDRRWRYQCLVGGRPLGRDQWRWCRPKRGTRVVMRPRLRVVGIAAAIAAIGSSLLAALPAGGALVGAIGGGLGALGLTGAGYLGALGLVSGVAAIGLTFGASFLFRQLVKPPQAPDTPSLGGARLGPGFQGIRNDARPYQPVSVVFGTHRVFPALAAEPYTETDGGTTIARMLFGVAMGPVEISDVRIGEVPIESFDGAEVYVRSGEDTDPGLQLFESQIFERPGGYQFPVFKASDPDPLESPWRQNVTEPETEEIVVELAMPQGLFRFNDKGDLREFGFNLELAYKLTTDTNWIPFQEDVAYPVNTGAYPILGILNPGRVIPDLDGNTTFLGNAGTNPDRYSRYQIRARSQDAFFVTLRARVAKGTYDVRMRRVESWARRSLPGHKETAAVGGDFVWNKIRSLNADQVLAPEVLDGAHRIATIEVRIPIRDQFGGFVETLNCLVKGKHRIYDPLDPSADPITGWTGDAKVTSNPAAALVAVYTKYLQTPIPDSRMDWDVLTAWYDTCETAGYECNAEQLQAKVSPEWAEEVASTGRGSFDEFDSLLSVVVDEPKDVPEQMLTPVNSTGSLRFTQAYTDPPHAVRVRHIDSDNGYDPNGETVVYYPGFDENNATRFEELRRYGAATKEQAYSDGLYFMAVDRLRRRVVFEDMDIEQLWLRRGSFVKVAHDYMAIGRHWGRVVSTTVDGSNNILTATLDEVLSYFNGEEYAVEVRVPGGTGGTTFWSDGSSWSDGSTWVDPGAGSFTCFAANVDNPAGPAGLASKVVTFETPLAPGQLTVGDLVAFGLRQRVTAPFLVRSIRPRSDFSGQLELIDYAGEIFDVDDPGNIPPFDPGSTSPVPPLARAPLQPEIAEVIADERALLQATDGSLVPRIILVLKTQEELTADEASLPKASVYELQIRNSTLDEPSPLLIGVMAEGEDESNNQPGTSWRAIPDKSAGLTRLPITEVSEGVFYDVRVRSRSDTGVISAWTTLRAVLVVGKTSPPPDVAGFERQGDYLVWTLPNTPVDLLGFEIRYRRDTLGVWDTALRVPGIDENALIASSPFFIGHLELSAQEYLIKAVDRSRNESLVAQRLRIPVTEIAPRNFVIGFPFASPAGPVDWPGTITDGSVSGVDGALEADLAPGSGDTQPFWGSDDSLPFWGSDDSDPFWGANVYLSMLYQAGLIVPRSFLPSARVELDITMDQGPDPLVEYRHGHRTKPIVDASMYTAILGTINSVGVVQDPDGRDAAVIESQTGVDANTLGRVRATTSRSFWGTQRGLRVWVRTEDSVFDPNNWGHDEGLKIRLSEGTGGAHERVYRLGLDDLLMQPEWQAIVIDFDATTPFSTFGNGALSTFDPDQIEVSINDLSAYDSTQTGVSSLDFELGPVDLWIVESIGAASRDDVVFPIDNADDVGRLSGVSVTVELEDSIVYDGSASARLIKTGVDAQARVVDFEAWAPFDFTESLLVMPVYIETAHYDTLDPDRGISIRVYSDDGANVRWSAYQFGSLDIPENEWALLLIAPGVDATEAVSNGGVDPLYVNEIKVQFNAAASPQTDAEIVIDRVSRISYLSGGWQPWPGRVESADNEAYEFRLAFQGAPDVQDRMDEMEVNVDVVDIDEVIEQTIAGGLDRLDITKKPYRSIEEVFVEITGTTAVSVRVIDTDALRGPEIETLNASGTRVADTVRARVRGY